MDSRKMHHIRSNCNPGRYNLMSAAVQCTKQIADNKCTATRRCYVGYRLLGASFRRVSAVNQSGIVGLSKYCHADRNEDRALVESGYAGSCQQDNPSRQQGPKVHKDRFLWFRSSGIFANLLHRILGKMHLRVVACPRGARGRAPSLVSR